MQNETWYALSRGMELHVYKISNSYQCLALFYLVIQSCHISISLYGASIQKILKSRSTEGWKMKLGILLVEEWNFMCAKFQIFTTCATWLFGCLKTAILAPRPTSNGYISLIKASRCLSKYMVEWNALLCNTIVAFEWFYHLKNVYVPLNIGQHFKFSVTLHWPHTNTLQLRNLELS